MKNFDSSSELIFTDEELPVIRPKSRLVRREPKEKETKERKETNTKNINVTRRQTRSMTTEKDKEEMDRVPYLREESSSSKVPTLPKFSSKPLVIDLVSPPTTPKILTIPSFHSTPKIPSYSQSEQISEPSSSSKSKSLGSESSQSESASESRSNLSFVEKDESSSPSYTSTPESILVSSENNSDERIDYQLAQEHYSLFNALKIFNWLSMSIEEFNKFLSNPYIDKKLYHFKSMNSNGARGAKKVPFDGIMKSYWVDELEILDILPRKDICCICLYTRTTTRKIKTYDRNLGGVGPDCYELKLLPLFDLVDLIKRAVDLISLKKSKKYRPGTIGFDREIYRPFNEIVDRISQVDIKMADRY